MAFAERGTTVYAGNDYNPLTVQKPSGTLEGDMMVAWLCGDSSNRKNITPPSGWSVIYDQSSPDLGGSAQMFGYYKVATASEPSSYGFTFSGSVGFSKGILTSWYDTGGVGTWSVVDLGGGNKVTAASITSLSISGSGLYITAFLSDNADNPTTDNSPVAEIVRNVSNSLGFIMYGGNSTTLNSTITQNWDASDDLYANNVIFGFSSSGDYVSKIKIGNAYKNIIDGWVAVDSNSSGSPDVWKKIESGRISQGIGNVATSWKTVFKDGK